MPMTEYNGNTDVIASVGTTPQERGLTTDEFKSKFDEGLKAFVEWFNTTHKTEFDIHLVKDATTTQKGHVQLGTETGTAAEGDHVLNTATETTLGHVKVPSANIDASGLLIFPSAGSGSWAVISDTTLSTDAAQVNITGIPTSYKALKVIAVTLATNTTPRNLKLRLNDIATGYYGSYLKGMSTTASSVSMSAATELTLEGVLSASNSFVGMAEIDISSNGFNKVMIKYTNTVDYTNVGVAMGAGTVSGSSPVTKISFIASADLIKSGSRFILMGIS